MELPELTTIDLFAGAGGITEGFRGVGARSLYANDINPLATATFARNHPDAHVECAPLEHVDPRRIRCDLGLSAGELDVLVGGPPCQGFSINAPGRFLDDPRNALFREYIRFLDEFEPKAFLIENVPGMLSLAGGAIFEQIIELLEQRGYRVSAKVLFAPHYGVPQARWRLIILGSQEGLAHPKPTHYARARANFRGGKTMVFQLDDDSRDTLLPACTVFDALGDLPRIPNGGGVDACPYSTPPSSDLSAALRAGSDLIFDHVAPRLSRINEERVRHIPPGGSWRDIPVELLPAGMRRARRSDHTKRYGRLRADGLASTIMTKCDPHWGPVFLPDQDRALSVREAARLQTFPDRYRFDGPRVAQYEQIGNAVPVMLANAIARAIAAQLARTAQLELAAA